MPGFDGNSLVYVIFPQRINPDSFIDTFVPTAIIGFVCLDDSFRILSPAGGHCQVWQNPVVEFMVIEEILLSFIEESNFLPDS